MKNKRLSIILASTVFLLFIPFVAMQFTNEVNWKMSDFVIMGALLLSMGLAFEFTLLKITSIKYRIIIGATIFVVCFLIWAELAVGLFGTPFAGS
jgi:hypothetical protein